MISLYVFDFDKTLVPFDSFRRYLIYWMKYVPFTILKNLLLRKLRVLSSKKLKQEVLQSISRNPKFHEINRKFIDQLVPYLNQNMIDHICSKDKGPKIVLILSASPDVYVSDTARAIGLTGRGSYFINNQFVHLHGTGKVEFIKQYYPINSYRYVYSVSDSKSDLELLKLFETYELI